MACSRSPPSSAATPHPQAALPAVVQMAERHLKPIKHAFDTDCRARLGRELDKLKTLQHKHFAQLEIDFAKGIEQVNAARRKQRESDTADLFKNYQQWIKDTLELDDRTQLTDLFVRRPVLAAVISPMCPWPNAKVTFLTFGLRPMTGTESGRHGRCPIHLVTSPPARPGSI